MTLLLAVQSAVLTLLMFIQKIIGSLMMCLSWYGSGIRILGTLLSLDKDNLDTQYKIGFYETSLQLDKAATYEAKRTGDRMNAVDTDLRQKVAKLYSCFVCS